MIHVILAHYENELFPSLRSLYIVIGGWFALFIPVWKRDCFKNMLNDFLKGLGCSGVGNFTLGVIILMMPQMLLNSGGMVFGGD